MCISQRSNSLPNLLLLPNTFFASGMAAVEFRAGFGKLRQIMDLTLAT